MWNAKQRAQSTLVVKEKALQRHMDQPRKHLSNHALKKIMATAGVVYECAVCGITKWQLQVLSLELDHIDGDSFNNTLANLRLLCPNCHSLTENFRGKNKNSGNKKVSNDQLLEALQTHKNIRQALISVGLSPRGGNYSRAATLMAV